MIIKIQGKDYGVPISFHELTIDAYLGFTAAFGKPFIERLSIYTSIPANVLNEMNTQSIGKLSEAVAFIEDIDLLNSLADAYSGTDVGAESLQKLETAKKIIKAGAGQIAIAEHYTGQAISGRPLLETWRMVRFYHESINAFFDRFKEMNNHEYTDDELEAGVEELNVFGYFPMVVEYGKNRGMTNDQVLALPAIEVYMELLIDYRKGQYAKRLQEIHKAREEHFSKLVK